MKLPLEAITVGERRREDYGDIASLAASIRTYGLLHPIIVDQDGNLVAGERRLRAVHSLGWESVDVRDMGELSEAERAEIELEENLQRKDLTSVERSKTVVKLAETARTVLQEEAEFQGESPRNGAGRPPDPTSERAVSERIGIDRKTIREAERHVETAEQYPELQAPGWRQYHVLEARERLDKLPEPERPKAVALVTQSGVDPKSATEILGNLAVKPAEDRERIYAKAASADSRDQSDALTEAAERPAMPDPRISLVMDAIAALGKALRLFPGDPMNDHIAIARDTAKDTLESLKEYRRGV